MLFVCKAHSVEDWQEKLGDFLSAHTALNVFLQKEIGAKDSHYSNDFMEQCIVCYQEKERKVAPFVSAYRKKPSVCMDVEFALEDFDCWHKCLNIPQNWRRYVYLRGKVIVALNSVKDKLENSWRNDFYQQKPIIAPSRRSKESWQTLKESVQPYLDSLASETNLMDRCFYINKYGTLISQITPVRSTSAQGAI